MEQRTSQADWVTARVEETGNPFLLRQWRRSGRARSGPLTGAMILCGLATGLLLIALFALLLVERRPTFELFGETVTLPAGIIGPTVRWFGTVTVGLGCWLMLFISYHLSSAQCFEEEKQSSLELLLTIPQSRGRMVLQIAAWPLLNVLILILPLLPVVACLMPILGLSFGPALRLLLCVGALCLLVCLRAPSGRALQGVGAARPSQALGLAVVALFGWPLVAWLAASRLGWERLGLTQWPFGLADLTVLSVDCWRGTAHLGLWFALLVLLCGLARWLGGWSRLSEGSDWQPLPAAAVGWPAVVLTVWLIAGVVWARSPTATRDLQAYGGLLLTFSLLSILPCTLPGGSAWHWLWWPARKLEHPLGLALLRLADSLLLLAGAPLLFVLGSGADLGALPASAARMTFAALAVVMVAVALQEHLWRRVNLALAAGATADALARLHLVPRLLLAAWLVTGLCWIGETSDEGAGIAPIFLLWPFELGLAVAGLAFIAWLLPPLLAVVRPRRAAGESRRDVRPALLWRLLPPAWRDNPLAVKAHRKLRRQGLTSALLYLVLVLGLLGLVPAVVVWFLPAERAATGAWYEQLLFLTAVLWQQTGEALARALFGLTSIPASAAAMLAVVLFAGGGVLLVTFLLSAVLAGRMVTEERVAGSLGFLLMSPLRDVEVAEGFLIGHLFAVFEAVLAFLLLLAVWAVISLHWAVIASALVVAVMLLGMLLLTSGLAFLGTARYETRANGTPLALLGVAGMQFGIFSVISTVIGVSSLSAVTTGTTPQPTALPALIGAGWALVTLLAGVATWRSCAGAITWLRRLGRLWRAFEPASARR